MMSPKKKIFWNFSERQAKQNEQKATERQDNYVIVNQIFTK